MKMTKVSYLRLIMLLCGIALAVGQTSKIDSDKVWNATTATNESTTAKGLSFTIFCLESLINRYIILG